MSSELPTSLTVEESLPQERLDVFLREYLPTVSRGTIQRLLGEGSIRVDGQAVKPNHRPRAGEVITLQWPEAKPDAAQPEDLPLDILHEDKDLLVLNKPAGLVVHPGAGHAEHTLVNALLHHCAGELSGIGGVARPGIVHRLDKNTSGCLVVAKNDETHLKLSEEFAGRFVLKIYQALVCGHMPAAKGEIDRAIARHPQLRKQMTVVEKDGREARTSYRVAKQLRLVSLIDLRLHTGRTHQIRVHLEHLGVPVVGDLVYGKRANARLREESGFKETRQMLHAGKLGFVHPRTTKYLTFEAPLPKDFRAALKFFDSGKGK